MVCNINCGIVILLFGKENLEISDTFYYLYEEYSFLKVLWATNGSKLTAESSSSIQNVYIFVSLSCLNILHCGDLFIRQIYDKTSVMIEIFPCSYSMPLPKYQSSNRKKYWKLSFYLRSLQRGFPSTNYKSATSGSFVLMAGC